MSLTERLNELVRACFTGIWIESHEHEDALADLANLCRQEDWRLATWDIDQGLRLAGADTGALPVAADPLSAVKACGSLPPSEAPTLVVLVNFQRFLGAADTVQALAHQLAQGKQSRTSIVILAAHVILPAELDKQFVVVEHALPSREQLTEMARSIATSEELPSGLDWERTLDAAVGLTRVEAENAFSLSLVRHGRLTAEVLWEQKTQLLKKSGQLTLHRGGETFAQLGGLESLKAFCLRALRRPGEQNPLLRPRGVLLLSPPGCGKSQFAKALGQETGRPTLVLDLGSLLGSLVGESERNLRQVLRMVDAMAPCVLYVDELEKGLAGASGNQGDSGVSSRLFGQLLVWLNDHTSDVFFIGTCNDISRLPPEFARAERFDGVVFIDLPSASERAQIWQLYLTLFQLEPSQPRPRDEQWTGAEIRACCRLAALLDIPLLAAAQNIAPVAVMAAESVERLRTWACGRCLSATQPGLYEYRRETPAARRKVTRAASEN
jgi:SpoVK/Ycf46/Vps4 family AAA+-type ATPase